MGLSGEEKGAIHGITMREIAILADSGLSVEIAIFYIIKTFRNDRRSLR